MKPTTAARSAAQFVFLDGAPCLSLACGAASPATHVGRLLSLHKGAGTFPPLDTEIMSPVTLSAGAALLDQVSSMLYHAYQNDSGGVVVSYGEVGDTLRAPELK